MDTIERLQRRWVTEENRKRLLDNLYRRFNKHKEVFRRKNFWLRYRQKRQRNKIGWRWIFKKYKYWGQKNFTAFLEKTDGDLIRPREKRSYALIDLRGFPFGESQNALSAPEVEGIIFRDADLSYALFNGTWLRACEFHKCVFTKTMFTKCHMESLFVSCRFDDADFDHANLLGKLIFRDCSFHSCKLTNWGSGGAELYHTIYENCDFRKGALIGSPIEDCTFVNCRFAGCWASEAMCRSSKFVACDFEQSHLHGTVWDGTEFENCYFGEMDAQDIPPHVRPAKSRPTLKRQMTDSRQIAKSLLDVVPDFAVAALRAPFEKVRYALDMRGVKVKLREKRANADETALSLTTGPDRVETVAVTESEGGSYLWGRSCANSTSPDIAVGISEVLKCPSILIDWHQASGSVLFCSVLNGAVKRFHYHCDLQGGNCLDEGEPLASEELLPFVGASLEDILRAANGMGFDLVKGANSDTYQLMDFHFEDDVQGPWAEKIDRHLRSHPDDLGLVGRINVDSGGLSGGLLKTILRVLRRD